MIHIRYVRGETIPQSPAVTAPFAQGGQGGAGEDCGRMVSAPTAAATGEAEGVAGEILLVVSGHAGFAQPGADPVCAGVSALVLTLAANLTDLAAAGTVRDPEIHLQPGFALLSCRCEPGLLPVARLVFDTLWSGLTVLSGLYPQNISCKISN